VILNANQHGVDYAMKHRIVHQKYSLNPPITLALALGLPLPGYALLETKGRKTAKPRRAPVGDGRVESQFWLVAEHGMRAGYVRNIERDPHVPSEAASGPNVSLAHGYCASAPQR